MTIIAVDFGTRRIGLAISAPDLTGALPLGTIKRQSLDRDLAAIAQLIEGRNVSRIVMGLPLNSDGSDGRIARMVRDFGARLASYLGLPLDFQDERLTSFEAGQRAVVVASPRHKRGILDAIAAQVILEDWLQTHRDAS